MFDSTKIMANMKTILLKNIATEIHKIMSTLYSFLYRELQGFTGASDVNSAT